MLRTFEEKDASEPARPSTPHTPQGLLQIPDGQPRTCDHSPKDQAQPKLRRILEEVVFLPNSKFVREAFAVLLKVRARANRLIREQLAEEVRK